MSLLRRFNYFLWYFGHVQVPLIGHLKPKIIALTDEKIIILVPLKRRSKNHLKSMYFGALAVGADLAGGLHGFYHANNLKLNISLAFKSFQAQFYKRPESGVYFVCDEGNNVKTMLLESQKTGTRINQLLSVKAYTTYMNNPELVADFKLELSIKVRGIER